MKTMNIKNLSNPTAIVGIIAVILALAGFAKTGGLGVMIIVLGIILTGAAWLFNFHIGKTGDKSQSMWLFIMIAIFAIAIPIGGVQTWFAGEPTPAYIIPGTTVPLQVDAPVVAPFVPTTGLTTAKLTVPATNAADAVYAGAGIYYFLDPSVTTDRYGFMKIITNGNTGMLKAPSGVAQANAMTQASNAFTQTYLSAAIGQNILLCGYEDATPAAGEETSVCKTIVLNGVTAGSTPEWMWQFADGGNSLKVFNYSSFKPYNDADTAVTQRWDNRTATLANDVQTFYVFSATNGQKIQDAALYMETSAANLGYIVSIKITNLQTGEVSPQFTAFANTANMDTTNPAFIAAPATTYGLNEYFVGNFPGQAIRYGTQDLGKYKVEVTLNHPAASASYLFKATENTHALTSTGGHYEWAANMLLNLSSNAAASSWI